MPKVVKASAYGFCGGVRSAVEKAVSAADKAKREGIPCYVYGNLVHSRVVMSELEALGVEKIDSPSGHEPGYLIIRAHGIGDRLRSEFEAAGFLICDATCPVVLRNMERLRQADNPVIIGQRCHAEVQALLGCRNVPVVESTEESEKLPEGKYQAVVQTTFSENELASIRDKGRIEPLNTICMASEERRKALRTIIGDVDAIVVVGDSISANTMELVSISRSYGKPTFLISSDADIDEELFCYNRIGLTAGASAPDSLVDAVRRKIEEHG